MSGRTTNINAPIPQPNVPFVSADGILTRQGYYFLLSMFNRLGGSAAPVNLAVVQAQINSLFVEDAMSDVPEPTNVAPAFLLAWTGDPEPPAPLNPILAALLVTDAL